MKHFLIQKNIWNEYGYDSSIESLSTVPDVSFQEVNCIPFTSEFDAEVTQKPDCIFGSGRFVNICRERKYPTFSSFAPIELDIFAREYWINGNGQEMTWKQAKSLNITEPLFVKPFTEKFFTGLLIEKSEDFEKVQLASSFIENEDDEKVWVASPVNIITEVRYFVIGGKIITGSVYKINGIGNHIAIDQTHDSYSHCQNLLNNGILRNGMVIDLGSIIDNGLKWKIVELNNLNSAGFYKCNTSAIVNALKYLE